MKTEKAIPFELKLVAYTFLAMGVLSFASGLFGLFNMKPNIVSMNAYINYFFGLVCLAAYQYLLQLRPIWHHYSVLILKGLILLLSVSILGAWFVYYNVMEEGNPAFIIPFIIFVYYWIVRYFGYCVTILERDEIRGLYRNRRVRTEIDIINESIYDGMSKSAVMKLNRDIQL